MTNYFRSMLSVLGVVAFAMVLQFAFTQNATALTLSGPADVDDLRVIGNTLYWTTPDTGADIESFHLGYYTGVLPTHTADGSQSEMAAQGIDFLGCMPQELKFSPCVSAYSMNSTPGATNYAVLSSSYANNKSYIVRSYALGEFSDYSNVVIPNYSSSYKSGNSHLTKEGSYLRWYAPANVNYYKITYYTGPTTKSPTEVTYGGCNFETGHSVDYTPKSYCAGNTQYGDKVTRAYNHKEALNIGIDSDTYRVRAYNFSGTKIMDAYGPTPPVLDPDRITNLSFDRETRRLSWSAPDDADKYVIRFYTGNYTVSPPNKGDFGGCSDSSGTTCASSSESYNYVGNEYIVVDNNWNYKSFIIYYRNSDGVYSEASNAVYVTPYVDEDPSRITDLSYDRDTRRLSWSAPEDANKYVLRFYTGNYTDSTPDKDDFGGCSYPSGTSCASVSNGYNYIGYEYIVVDERWQNTTFMIYYRNDDGFYSEASNPAYILSDVVFPEPPGSPFVDIFRHPYEYEIIDVYERGIVEGYAGGYFRPDYKLNRAELLKIVLVSEYPTLDFERYASDSCFDDVWGGDWWAGYICFAKSRGIVEGYPDGTFRPTSTVSFPEALKMAMETIEPLDYYFETDDVDPNDWFMPYLYNGRSFIPDTAEGSTWYSGSVSNDEYRNLPYRAILRGEMAYMIDQMLERLGR